MKRSAFLLLAAAGLFLVSCKKEHVSGSGPVVTQNRNVSNFSGVRAKGAANVHITQGAVFSVQVKEYSNLQSHYDATVIGSTLELGFSDDSKVRNSKAEVFITMPELDFLQTEGSGDIQTSGTFPPVSTFTVASAGSGDISIENGSTDHFTASTRGSGAVKAFGLIAKEAVTQTEGSGNMEIRALDKLNVSIAGSGNVYYKGTPVLQVSISGNGQVIPQ